jgi:DNA-binding response OmpR family regulator/predicted transcriptional regulator
MAFSRPPRLAHDLLLQSMTGEPFQALLVSTDRPLLRRLSGLLESIGCNTDSIAEPQQARSLVEATRPDFLLVDTDLPGDVSQALCRAATDVGDATLPAVVLALVARRESARIPEILAAGADDILHKPLVPGEVLARVRAAARLREQQGRRYFQQGNAQTPGCLPSPAWRALAGEVARQAAGSGACVLMTIDHFRQHAALLSRMGAVQLQSLVIERLQAAGGEGVVWGELEDDCFGALLTSSDDVAALSWAERLRVAVADRPFPWLDQAFHVTMSMGVAPLAGNEALAEQRARGALRLAQSSGHNYVASAAEWDHDQKRQADQPSWMESATAWDIMLPAPLALYPDDTLEQAALLLAQTQFSHLPVADDNGRLVGLVSARSVNLSERKTDSARKSASIRFVRAIMQATPAQCEDDEPVRKLASFFASEPTPVVVVTRQGKPLGLIHNHALSGMLECLSQRTFSAGRRSFSLDSSYLAAPETWVAEEA